MTTTNKLAVQSLVLILAICPSAIGQEVDAEFHPINHGQFHVSPEGRPDGDGSAKKPWDLATALAHPTAVKPGYTLWIHEGIYRGGFRSELKGEPGAAIIVRPFPGERAIIDTYDPDKMGDAGFYLLGEWARFQGLEVMCSNPKRKTETRGSWPGDVRRGSVEVRGSHIQCINLLVHDLGNGMGFWASGEGGEIYGCLIFQNGWSGPDRGHGHAIYAQNKTGIKRIQDNIIFNQFGEGIDVFGSPNATLKGFRIEGNIAFNNGCLHGTDYRTYCILTGGDAPVDDVRITKNATYGGLVQLGYPWGKRNGRVEATDNYLGGGVRMFFQEDLMFTGNTVLEGDPLNSITMAKGVRTKKLEVNRNTYYYGSKKLPRFAFYRDGKGGTKLLEDWRALGFDNDSPVKSGRPPANHIVLRPNLYEPGRAHIAVYNWEKKESVKLGLQKVLKPGQSYRVVNAQNFHGPAVVSGTYDGTSITLPMKPTQLAQPVGMPTYKLPITQPEFGAFVLLPVKE